MAGVTKVGIDIVDIARFKRFWASLDAGNNELFTPAEVESARAGRHVLASLAGRFAAKEAVFKLLEDLDPFACDWASIEIVAKPSGGLAVQLHGAAAEVARQRRFGDIAVSLSHSRSVAVAAAIVCESC